MRVRMQNDGKRSAAVGRGLKSAFQPPGRSSEDDLRHIAPHFCGEARLSINGERTIKNFGETVSRVYLDWNATAPLAPAAREAALEALSSIGNASSVHAEGRAKRALVERARRSLADRFGVPADRVTFTSGGTEANAMALAPGLARVGGAPAERLVTSAVEHAAVRAGGRFPHTTVVEVDSEGRIDLAALEAALSLGPKSLVSVMAANNETGVLQPLADVQAIAARHDALFHTDAVQAFGRIPEERLTADLVSLSGHKIGAPLGVGALVRLSDVVVPPFLSGGGQERGARGGTENVPAIAGFAAALDAPPADPGAWNATAAARDAFEVALLRRFTGARVFGAGAPRLANTSLFSMGGMPADLALIALDLAGFALSSGAACSSGKVGVSHVLLAMGVSESVARTALRASAGPVGARSQFDALLDGLERAVRPMAFASL